jgi:N-acetylneuraminic acid mutarotase
MNQERAKSSFLIVNNFIYAFYGYNYIQNKYINNIEYYDNNLWKEIYINNNNLNGIIEHICYVDFNNDIIILGGINEKGFNKNFYKLNLNNNKIINIGQEKINDEKNFVFNSQIIILKNDYNSENYILSFDKNNNIHRFSPYEISNHQIIIYK